MHYPTDINLLFDAVRKVIHTTSTLTSKYGLSDWRQYKYNIKQLKQQLKITEKKKRTGGTRTEQQKFQRLESIKQAHKDLLLLTEKFLVKSRASIEKIDKAKLLNAQDLALLETIDNFRSHAERQIDQIIRRVFEGEKIPHKEKVFSIFEPHTEWIVKGKAKVSFELGMRVCILEDQHQFILHHKVMEKETDDKVALGMIKHTKSIFPNMTSCSFDKAFHTPVNQVELAEYLDVVGLKRKGKLSKKAKEIETSEVFKKACKKHSAVESAINALEVHGLDKCKDHGIYGFKRYVGLSIVARNTHIIGDKLHKKEQAKIIRKNNRCRDGTTLFAA